MTYKTAISFDFWNTLYADGAENNRMVRRKELFKKSVTSNRDVSDLQINRVFDLSFEYFLTEWRDKMRTPSAEERISLMADHLKVDLPSETRRYLAEEFGKLIMEIPPLELDGVKNAVQLLSENYSLGIISDTGFISGRHIREFLKIEGIYECFSSFIFSDEQVHSKPHRSVFEKTAETLKIPLQGLIHIGDLEHTDILGAFHAGCRSIKFTGANHRSTDNSKANRVVHTYHSLLQAIADLVNHHSEMEQI